MSRFGSLRSLAALPLACLLAACGGGSSGSSTASPTQAEVQDALDAITATGVTGVLLRLGGPFGKEVLTSGVADPASGRRATSASTFRIASIAKAFSGAVILSLVRDGLVDLDDTVEEWLPGQLPRGDEVHVHELLNHTSGVFNYTADPEFLDRFGGDPLGLWTPEELVAVAARHDLNFDPGTAYAYSNTDNIIVGLIAEAATGQPYGDLLQQRIFAKLGLRHTQLPTTPALPDPFIHGFFRNADGSVEDVSEAISPSGVWASGAIISTPDELARFIGALVAGQLYGGALRAEAMITVPGDSQPPGLPGPGTNNAGLALFRYDAECGPVWGHTGRFPGYRNYALATPDGGRTLVLTLNQEPAPDTADLRILHALELAVCRLVDL
jgi:D-alanyl-D-alanine carboxypeptidase